MCLTRPLVAVNGYFVTRLNWMARRYTKYMYLGPTDICVSLHEEPAMEGAFDRLIQRIKRLLLHPSYAPVNC